MNQPLRLTLATAILAAFSLSSHAADAPTVTISGFGTAALTATDTDDVEYARFNQAAGVGKSPRAGVDSNFGIQGTARMNDWLSFTAQGLARKNARDSYGAELSWAFAKFKVSDEISIRVGRIGMPIYMISDFRQVGYANTMIRPSQEVYGQIYGDSYDGVDAMYQHNFGDTTVTAQIGVGTMSARITDNNRIKYKPATTVNIVAENGPFTVRFGRADAKVSVEDSESIDGLIATLHKVGMSKVANDLSVTDVDGSFTSLGFTMDYKNILVQGEYAVRKTDSLTLPDTSSYYAMLGYRFGKVTPYYYYGTVKQDSARTYTGLPASGPLAALGAGVNVAIKAGLQTSNALGVRWDFHKSAALKVQVDRIKPRDGAGTFLRAKPGFSDTVNVYAAGIDFVF
ncbi:porin [Massilia sp. DJPM01]|uniref:porin n=1 Tax=Massilia sp. DJPM01 TaxID=3024404 RepID=UPI00259EFD75|nr:porin [Massilia sp. DJPM01]MDM5176952.1 porin [Massilia sp. DJPM01]